MIPRKTQAKFYLLHLRKMEQDYLNYWNSEALALFNSNRLQVGLYEGFDAKRGNILVRFRKNRAPRKNMHFTCFVPRNEFKNVNDWKNIAYHTLRHNAYDNIISGGKSIYYQEYKLNNDFIIVGFSNIDLKLKDCLVKNTLMVFAEPEPPYAYLQALENLTKKLPDNNPVLDLAFNNPNWTPLPLAGSDNIHLKIIEELSHRDEIIIQGPPGTGKTYLMAQLCQHFLKEHKSVVVTALTNRALMELASKKDFLEDFLKRSKVHKTSLAADEQVENPNLKRIDEVLSIKGELILSSYYSLSQYANNYPEHPLFDVVIIEEASQAFLGTLAIFKLLARKLIIVGDPMQLPPVWHESEVEHLHKNIRKIAYGLETYAYYSNTKAFRLIYTYRLPERATKLTGVFYDDSIISKAFQKPPFDLNLPEKYSNMLNPDGGVSFLYLNLSNEGKTPETAMLFAKEFTEVFEENNPDKNLAILSPFRKTNSYLQSNIYTNVNNLKNVTIETIDRIQGLTTDFVIFVIPFSGVRFATDQNRFNVATSRSKTHTLIILDKVFESIDLTDNIIVKSFIDQAKLG
jgi:DNA replication ATP-dependent helicase Dna2